MKTRRIVFAILIIVLSIAMFSSCNKKTTEPDLPDGQTIVADETVVIPPTTAETIIDVTEDQIVFPGEADEEIYQVGNIITSEPTSVAPYGLLRKVVSYSSQGNQVVVNTAPARLEDAFDELDLNISQDLKTSDIESTHVLIDGIVFKGDTKNPYNFLYEIDYDTNLGSNVALNINGDLNLTLGNELQIKISLLRGLHYVKAGSFITSNGDLELTVDGSFSYTQSIDLVEHCFYPVTFFVGAVPIVLVPKVVVVLDIDASGQASVNTSVTASASLSAGVIYQKPNWSTYQERSLNFDPSTPILSAAMDARVSAGPRFEVNLYGMAGPFAYGRAWMDLNADISSTPWWVLSGGYNVDAGVKFDALGYVADFTVEDIINFSTILAQAPQNQVNTPTFSPPGGDYSTAQNVSISCSTAGATIRYTTNGSEPSSTSAVYSSPINVSATTTIKAKGFKDGWTASAVASAIYTITPTGTVATPSFNPAGGSYSTAQNVSISCSTAGATIRYTTNGSEPSSTSAVYSSPINVSATTTIKAKGFKDGWTASAVASAIYTITPTGTVATPTFNPAGGSYSTAQNVSISCSTAGATIRYTTNGSEPSSTSAVYSSPINVSATTTIKAKGFKDGWTASPTASSTYTIGSSPGQMVYVPAGTFTMGRTTGSGDSDELPTHSVSLDSFYMGKYQVTQSEYAAIMGSNPASGYGVGDNYPVYSVSWYSAVKYCNLRSMAEGLTPVYSISGSTNPASWGAVPSSNNSTWNAAICNFNANGYRLPTEAEWEYAARGATNDPDYLYSGSDDINAVAWYDSNSGGSAHIVGTKAPNALGLYDMSGNLWEWCWDWYSSSYYSSSPSVNPTGPASGSYRVRRGGFWDNSANYCRVASRSYNYPNYSSGSIGFRLCRAVL